jgi:hypothetical protein
MVDEKSPAKPAYEAKPAEKPAEKAAKVPDVKAAPEGVGESSDPAVHKLLADRQALESNRETLVPSQPDADAVKAIDEQIAEVDKQLGELGYK